MPVTYLPPSPERTLTVIPDPERSYAYTVIEWDHLDRPTRRYEMFAGRRESIVHVWLSALKRENYLAQWETEESLVEGSFVVVATAIPVRLTRADRVDLLLNRIFALSCNAASRGDSARVDSLDARRDACERAWFSYLETA